MDFFDHSPIPMVVGTGASTLASVNAAFCSFVGYSATELVGGSIKDITHPDDWDASQAALGKLRSETGAGQRLEKRYIHKSGQVLWAEVNMCLVRDTAGTPRCMIAQLVDITERKRMQESLQESEDRLSRIIEQSPMSMAIVSMEGVIEYINRKSIATFGYSHEEIPTMERWWALAYPDAAYRAEVIETYMGHVKRAVAEKKEIEGGEYRVTCKDGTIKTVFIFGVPVSDKVFVMFDDITERKALQHSLEQSYAELEQKVKDRTAKLRAMAGEMIRVEHRERQRVAHVLHEDLQQWLAAAKFRVDELQEGAASPADRSASEKIAGMLDKAIGITRTLSTDLHPPVLYELGLKSILEWLAKDMSQKFDMQVTVRIAAELKPLSDELTLFVFDSVRELLMNVTKHAGVNAATVEALQAEGGWGQVEVRDAGCGFDPAKRNDRTLGLFSISERADAIGAWLEVKSEPGRGTQVTLTLP